MEINLQVSQFHILHAKRSHSEMLQGRVVWFKFPSVQKHSFTDTQKQLLLSFSFSSMFMYGVLFTGVSMATSSLKKQTSLRLTLCSFSYSWEVIICFRDLAESGPSGRTTHFKWKCNDAKLMSNLFFFFSIRTDFLRTVYDSSKVFTKRKARINVLILNSQTDHCLLKSHRKSKMTS